MSVANIKRPMSRDSMFTQQLLRLPGLLEDIFGSCLGLTKKGINNTLATCWYYSGRIHGSFPLILKQGTPFA